MRDTLKLEKIKLENTYIFSLNFHGKLYENLSIKIDNFKGMIRILWVTIDNRLEKLNNFRQIEQKLFKTILKTFKKQTKNTTLSLTF